jgi:hypothetical protein
MRPLALSLAPGLAGLALLAPCDDRHAPSYDDHADLLVVRDGEGRGRPVRDPADWAVRRDHILAHLQEVMGPLPGGERRVPLDVRVLEVLSLPVTGTISSTLFGAMLPMRGLG